MAPYMHNGDSEEEEEEEYTYEEVSEEEYELVTASEGEDEEAEDAPKTGRYKISKDRLKKNRGPVRDEQAEEDEEKRSEWMAKVNKKKEFVDPRAQREQAKKDGGANPWANVLKKQTPRGGEEGADEGTAAGGAGGEANPWAGVLKKNPGEGGKPAPKEDEEEKIPPWKREISKKKVGAVVEAVDAGESAAAKSPSAESSGSGTVSPRPKPTTQQAPQQFNRPVATATTAPKQFNRPIAQGAKQVVPKQFNRPAGGAAPAPRQIKSARGPGPAPVRGKFGAAAMPVKLSTAPAEQQIRELKAKYNAEKNVRINAVTKLENAVAQLNECRAALSRAEEIIGELVTIVKPGPTNASFVSDIDRLLADVEALGEGIPIEAPEPAPATTATEAAETKEESAPKKSSSSSDKKKSSSSGKKKSSSSSSKKKSSSSSSKKKSSSK
eukprot:CAMPEP_0174233884 /NCGR_PEP_ID=MMETSP0417-20130205/3802_1 /TAXON_ID=242541 /ORGANISM="Mayorella sp, Strain BSH-02190019" /LENGTH=438 /DNA_ID=CAMNT_0015312173 /DNA_START=101 /DNA_END=1414 /DNA_ORIENTATION=+